MAKEVRFRITVENKAKSVLKTIRGQFDRLGTAVKKASTKGKGFGGFGMAGALAELSKVMGPLTIAATALGGAFRLAFKGIAVAAKLAAGAIKAVSVASIGLAATIGKTIQVAANRGDLETGLGKLLGDAEKGKKLFGDLVKFSDETPFEVEPLIAATQKLLTFGFTADEVLPKLRLLGDASSAMKKPLDEIALAYGRLASAARQGAKTIDADVLNSLRDQGLLTEDVRKEILKLLAAGKGLEALKLFETKSLEKFKGSMAELSIKFNGLVSTIKGKANTALAKFGNVFLPLAEKAAAKLANKLDALNESGDISKFATVVKSKLGKAFDFVKERMDAWLDGGGLQRFQLNISNIAKEARGMFTDIFGGDEEKKIARLTSMKKDVTDSLGEAVDFMITKLTLAAPKIGAGIADGVALAMRVKLQAQFNDLLSEGGKGKAAGGVVSALHRTPTDPLGIKSKLIKSISNAIAQVVSGGPSKAATSKKDPITRVAAAAEQTAQNTGDTKSSVDGLGM